MKIFKWLLIVAGAVLISYFLANAAIGGSQDMASDMVGAVLWLFFVLVLVVLGFFVNKYLDKKH